MPSYLHQQWLILNAAREGMVSTPYLSIADAPCPAPGSPDVAAGICAGTDLGAESAPSLLPSNADPGHEAVISETRSCHRGWYLRSAAATAAVAIVAAVSLLCAAYTRLHTFPVMKHGRSDELLERINTCVHFSWLRAEEVDRMLHQGMIT